MKKIQFGLFGAGGSGREVMPYAKESVAKNLNIAPEHVDVYFVETWTSQEKTPQSVNGYPLISLDTFLALPGPKHFNVAIGDGRVRAQIVQKVSGQASPITLCGPQTLFFDNNVIGEGGVFCPNSLVTSNVTIGRFFQANYFSSIAHDCVIGDFVTFGPGARCNGRVHIGAFAYIGSNAVIKQGTVDKPLRIGTGAVIGMGAVVTKDVPDGVTVVGNPARVLINNK